MRAVPILATLALADVLLVSVGGVEVERAEAVRELRAQLLSTLVVAGAGCFTLVVLGLATRLVARYRHAGLRTLSEVGLGAMYAFGLLAFAGGTYLWMTPAHYPVAIVCGGSALLLAWQAASSAHGGEAVQ
jgi:hypothetical protein